MTFAFPPLQSFLTAALPVGLALLACAVDSDFLIAVPLTVLLASVVGIASYLVNVGGHWPIHALIGGAFGWLASVIFLLNLEI